MIDSDPYRYPNSEVLRNKLGITHGAELDRAERDVASQRIRQGSPTGQFDLRHLKAIHGHVFQDVYEWAGQVRTVDISKGGNRFQTKGRIETGMEDVHRRLKADNFLRNTSLPDFAAGAGIIIGDVNYVHPFREGNGRTQFLYLEQLARQAGHSLDLKQFDKDRWIEASRAAFDTDYEPMSNEIERALRQTKQLEQASAAQTRSSLVDNRSYGVSDVAELRRDYEAHRARQWHDPAGIKERQHRIEALEQTSGQSYKPVSSPSQPDLSSKTTR